MEKIEILEILINNKNGYCIREKVFKEKFKDHYDSIDSLNFPADFSFQQKLYHYLNEDDELKLGLCKCGNRCGFRSLAFGYYKHCSKTCMGNDEEFIEKREETYLSRFDTTHPMKKQEIKDKQKQTLISRYNVDNVSKLPETQSKIKETNQKKYGVPNSMMCDETKKKRVKNNINKYGVEYATQLCFVVDKIKSTNLKKYGCEFPAQNQQIQNKITDRKRKNHTFNSSKIENDFEKYLISQNINYIRQHKSQLYPYACDFYLPDYDLFIEIQGHWTHGGHPFNFENQSDINTLNCWKNKNTHFYNNAINTWTVRDVNKRNTTKQNNLKYLEIFSNDLEIVINTFENYFKKFQK